MKFTSTLLATFQLHYCQSVLLEECMTLHITKHALEQMALLIHHHMKQRRYFTHVSVVVLLATMDITRYLAIWHCTVIVIRLFLPWNMATLHITHPLPAYEQLKGEGVCRGYTAHEMCTMWLSSAVSSHSQAPLSLLCLDTDSE